MVTAGGTVLPMIQRDLEPIECEHTPVGSPLPAPVPVGVDASSLATRFLSLLHEELRPSLYILPRDSEGFLIDPLQTIMVAFRLGDPNALLLSLITPESLSRTAPSIDPNDLNFDTGELVYPTLLASSAIACGSSDQIEEPKTKYLCTITRDGWFPRLEVIVKREREEEQVPEEVPKKKRRVQKRKPLLWKSICRANLGDPCPDEQISQVILRPKQILHRPSHFL